jgi:hypothetical protein
MFRISQEWGPISRDLEKRRSLTFPEKAENVVVKRIENPATD